MRRALIALLGFGAVGWVIAQGPAMTVLRDTFEAPNPQWARSKSNVQFKEDAHSITAQFAHTAPSSEFIRVTAEPAGGELNPFIYYTYTTPHAPITDDTSGSSWVRASRPGVQIYARAVLPRERDPADASNPLSVLLPGEKYQLAGGRWQRLELRRLVKLLADERQRLRVAAGRDVDTTGAYVDQVVINVYTGAGVSELWIDDLELSPVVGDKEVHGQNTARSTAAPAPPPLGVKPIGPVPVEFQRDQLRVGGRPILFRAIRHSDTPIKTLRDAGLNTLFFSGSAPPSVCDEAVKNGFWLVPTVPANADTDTINREITRFAADDAVLAWHLGDWQNVEQLDNAVRTIATIRAADPNRPIAADIKDGFWSYSRHVDLLGAHRWPLFTSLELARYRDWLQQRHKLARPNTFLWTWIQTHLPNWYVDVLQPPKTPAGFAEPVGPHPEQVRLLTYISVAAGSRGIAYYSDRALADAEQGRDRLLGIATLNQELSLLEPLLVSTIDSPQWIDTTVPQVKAAVLRCERGVLVLPIWLGEGTQYVPEQGAASRLTMTVPQVPIGTQAWEVSPGEIRSLPARRVVGGVEVTLNEFDHTAAIVFTADNSPTGILVKWQDQVRKMSPLAAQWTYDLANVTLSKVERVQAQLKQLNVAITDSDLLLTAARERLQASRTAWEAGDYRIAYREAQRAQRPLRVLTRTQWLQLIRGFDQPCCAPYAVSYFSLPQHVAFVRQINASAAAPNQLIDGGFENGGLAGWQVVKNTLDEVEMIAQPTQDAQEGHQALRLEVKPKAVAATPGSNPPPPPAALERTFLGVESTPVRLTPGSLVRISFWVKIPLPLQATADGLVIYDSAAGEALGVRLTAPVPQWKKFTMYRRVPENGEVRVVVALTGLGVAVVDDVRIEPMVTKKEN
ncbi:MAG: hypothetical protein ACJ8C4_04790 [Gemmataceae bacterium]